MSSWPMLLGLLFMVAIAGVDAWLDRSSRKPLSWPEFRRIHRPDLTWWAKRRSRRERARVAVSVGKAP